MTLPKHPTPENMASTLKKDIKNMEKGNLQPPIFDESGKINITERRKAIHGRMKQYKAGPEIWNFRMDNKK